MALLFDETTRTTEPGGGAPVPAVPAPRPSAVTTKAQAFAPTAKPVVAPIDAGSRVNSVHRMLYLCSEIWTENSLTTVAVLCHSAAPE